MRPEFPRRLSVVEAIWHGRYEKITLSSEIRDCFEYFQDHSPKVLDSGKISEIHGSGITLRRVSEGKGFSIETGGKTQIVGKSAISKEEQEQLVRKIWHITFPYAKYRDEKFKKKNKTK